MATPNNPAYRWQGNSELTPESWTHPRHQLEKILSTAKNWKPSRPISLATWGSARRQHFTASTSHHFANELDPQLRPEAARLSTLINDSSAGKKANIYRYIYIHSQDEDQKHDPKGQAPTGRARPLAAQWGCGQVRAQQSDSGLRLGPDQSVFAIQAAPPRQAGGRSAGVLFFAGMRRLRPHSPGQPGLSVKAVGILHMPTTTQQQSLPGAGSGNGWRAVKKRRRSGVSEDTR